MKPERHRRFNSTLRVRMPAELVALLAEAANRRAGTVPDLVRQACVAQVTKMGLKYEARPEARAAQ